MTQIPAGWYPDPAQTHRGRQRYWDGSGWTEHVHDPAPPPAPAPGQPGPPAYAAYPTYPGGQAQQWPPASPQAYPHAYGQAAPQAYVRPRPTTPDGVPLSGWWWRVLAVILDGFIQIPLYVLVVVPVVVWQWDDLSLWFSALSDSVENNTPTPPDPRLLDPSSAPFLTMALGLALVSAAYSILFLRWKQATPGKLIVGLRVRRRETPGALPWGTILARVGFVIALGALRQLPVIGLVFGLVALLDYLWPLWDRNNQALHDKVARTNVVRPERRPDPVEEATAAGLPPAW